MKIIFEFILIMINFLKCQKLKEELKRGKVYEQRNPSG